MTVLTQRTIDVIRKNEGGLLVNWTANLDATGVSRDARVSPAEIEGQTREFIRLLASNARAGDVSIAGNDWSEARAFLERLSRSRALQGLDSQSTASFIFSLKRPLFDILQEEYASDPAELAAQVWAISELLDALGLHTIRTFQKSREEVIARQQEELLELSTPVVKLWDGVLALPMIGTLDSQRTQVVMESLLQRIVETGAEIAIIDITGVPTVDTLVAQHLLKTVTAIRLMGADAIISGVRPQIAQTIVHLGIDLQGIVTKANLAGALALALQRTGFTVHRDR
ncbi:STAS domain-containing protein [Luteibacter sp. SG786]|uniref:STAS domain-containing protein n=1 Tax=Luteibacter sp. SG786 TaxID=2587130 RepID=UPI0014234EE9|nr:STAS domain-containing protein [Luteibacter sp. SG786]NII52740.1 rsbT co-antagonist protein RsbR [Luteibacter sp. SG786]